MNTTNHEEKVQQEQQHFPEQKEKDSNKAGTPDKDKTAKEAKESAKNSK